MTVNRIKVLIITFFAIPLVAATMLKGVPMTASAKVVDDPAAMFKAKCAACHTANASKFYDPAKPEDEQVEAILKGKKGEKPPYMPAFEAKGITADDAKALAIYMKSLRAAGQ